MRRASAPGQFAYCRIYEIAGGLWTRRDNWFEYRAFLIISPWKDFNDPRETFNTELDEMH